MLKRAVHGMTGPQLFVLVGKQHLGIGGNSVPDLLSLMADDDDHILSGDLPCRINDIPYHRPASTLCKTLAVSDFIRLPKPAARMITATFGFKYLTMLVFQYLRIETERSGGKRERDAGDCLQSISYPAYPWPLQKGQTAFASALFVFPIPRALSPVSGKRAIRMKSAPRRDFQM